MNLSLVRTIGMTRAKVKIGMMNEPDVQHLPLLTTENNSMHEITAHNSEKNIKREEKSMGLIKK